MEELNVLIKQEPGKIEFSNFEEIKANVEDMMALYDGAVFTEDSTIPAKKEVAALRKIKGAIDTRRKDIKKKCLEPYNEFEIKANELMAIIDRPINLIEQQLVVFEQERKVKKQEAIKDIYSETIDGFEAYLPLEKIYNTKWENTSASISSIKEEINKAVDSTAQAISSISSMNSESVPEALKVYKKNLSIADAIAYINDYEQKKIEILKREEGKKKAEELWRIEQERLAEERRLRDEAKAKADAEAATIEAERIKKINDSFAQHDEDNTNTDIIGALEESEESDELSKPFEVSIKNDSQPFRDWTSLKVKLDSIELDQLKIFLDSLGIPYKVGA